MTSSPVRTTSCPICLDPFSSPSTCVPCGHVFCNQCIRQWNSYRGMRSPCPQCRTPISSIQLLHIGDGNIYLHQTSMSSQVVAYFHRQWFVLTNFVHDISSEVPTSLQEVEVIAARYNILSMYLTVRHLRHLPARLLLFWMNLGREIQIVSVLVSILLLSLVVKDLNSPFGIFNALVFPCLQLCSAVVREVMCVLLLLICRPLVCLGQCVMEILVAFWDVLIGVGVSLMIIAYNILLIPSVLWSAVVKWLSLLAVVISDAFLSILRLFFLACLVFIPGIFAQTTEQQRTQYFHAFLQKWNTFRERYKESVDRLFEHYVNVEEDV